MCRKNRVSFSLEKVPHLLLSLYAFPKRFGKRGRKKEECTFVRPRALFFRLGVLLHRPRHLSLWFLFVCLFVCLAKKRERERERKQASGVLSSSSSSSCHRSRRRSSCRKTSRGSRLAFILVGVFRGRDRRRFLRFPIQEKPERCCLRQSPTEGWFAAELRRTTGCSAFLPSLILSLYYYHHYYYYY